MLLVVVLVDLYHVSDRVLSLFLLLHELLKLHLLSIVLALLLLQIILYLGLFIVNTRLHADILEGRCILQLLILICLLLKVEQDFMLKLLHFFHIL